MLQPMQPTGQQQKPGMNIQRSPGQQMLPAGAAIQRGILPGGIASNPEDIKAAYGGTPAGQQKLQQAAGQGDYLSAIALSQILEEERERAAAKSAQGMQEGKPAPVVERMREEAVELRRQDLEEQQAKRLGMEQQRSQSAMAQMLQQASRPQMQGIAQLPAPNVAQPQAMAAGGIIAFDNGGEVVEKVTEEVVRPVGANPYAGMSNKQIVEKYGREQLGTSRSDAERRAREEYMKFAGYTPEERAAREKRIAQMEEYDKQAYDPDEMRQQRLIRALSSARSHAGAQALGDYGLASSLYYDKQRELSRQRMSERQKQQEAWEEAQRGARIKGYEAGTTEGKEVLAGQRQGIAGLGEVIQAETSAANAAMRAGGSGSGNKALEDASQAVARDRQIQEMTKYMRDNSLEPGSAEYNKYAKMIEDRERAIYAAFKVPYPEYPQTASPAEEPPKKEGGFWSGLGNLVSSLGQGVQKLQSGQSQKDAPIPVPADRSKMVAGQMYNTSRGPARWNGNAFEQ